MSIYDNETKTYLDLNPSAPQESQTYWVQKLTEIETLFLDEIETRWRQAKKETNKHNHSYRRHRLDHLRIDR